MYKFSRREKVFHRVSNFFLPYTTNTSHNTNITYSTYITYNANNTHEKITRFWLAKSSAVQV